MKKNDTAKRILAFISESEKLKSTIRHSYTSDSSRMESSAEHSWMMSLIAMTLFEHVHIKFDQAKVLKMIVLHDLAEAVIGDIPSFEVSERKTNKKQLELKAFKKLITHLPNNTKNEFILLWNEYEEQKTVESKIVQAIDKIESPLQHNLSEITTWDQNDFDIHAFYKIDLSSFDPAIKAFRAEVEKMSVRKIVKTKSLHRIKKEHRQAYKKIMETLEKEGV